MSFTGNMLWVLLLLPAVGAVVSLMAPSPQTALAMVAWGVALIAVAATWAVSTVLAGAVLLSGGEWLRLDALSAYHLLVMMIVFLLSSFFAIPYFRNEPEEHRLTLTSARRFAGLWFGALFAMTLVLLSNNLGIMWVGVEGTTLLTAFLVCLHVTPVSLEATWKYLIVCSVGVAFAFMGVLLIAASAGSGMIETHILHWTHMAAIAGQLDPKLAKLAFIFLLVGYGTKAGLAPMHNWLPDAHSQAPAPVSGIFSGFMLNLALYCIMRYIPLITAATGDSRWTQNLLVVFGLISILVAGGFILAQRDLKRLLAYCSVEHIGIIVLGLGLGPLGIFAALFHTLNHSVGKALAFFSAGRIGQIYGTHEMGEIRGTLKAAPLWGTGLFASVLALIGVAPFAVFMSELLILRAAATSQRYVALAAFLLGVGIVFVGVLRHAINMAWGSTTRDMGTQQPVSRLERCVVGSLILLLVLGVWMPPPLRDILTAASSVCAGGLK